MEPHRLSWELAELLARVQVEPASHATVGLEPTVVAPAPGGWVLVGFRIDDTLAADVQALTSAHVTFVQQTSVVASTLPAQSSLP